MIYDTPTKAVGIFFGMNIDQSAMSSISMDSSKQALQTNRKLISKFEIIFRINYNFSK